MFIFPFQLFDKDNHLNRQGSKYIFNTEGHVFPILQKFRRKPWEEEEDLKQESLLKEALIVDARTNKTFSNVSIVFTVI